MGKIERALPVGEYEDVAALLGVPVGMRAVQRLF